MGGGVCLREAVQEWAHVCGRSDRVVWPAASAELLACFDAGTRAQLTHEGGHYVPAADRAVEGYRRFLARFTGQ